MAVRIKPLLEKQLLSCHMSIVLRRNGKLTLTYVFQKKIIGLVGF